MPGNFVSALRELLRPDSFRATIRHNLQIPDVRRGLELVNVDDVRPSLLDHKIKRHSLIFVEHFLDGDGASASDNHTRTKVNLQEVLESSSLAGLLNAASWYKDYDERYIRSLATKEIGYRNDEIYLSDGKSTVVCSEGFWDEGAGHANPADPLTLYKFDIVLAIEFNLARLAYFESLLTYYQSHVDVQNVENANPLSVLSRVVDGRAILSHIEESLDLTLLVDHGFTRVLINRIREELGLDSTLTYIRRRITDASESVSLKSAVEAAVENNQIQRVIRVWAIVAVVVAVGLFVLNVLIHR
jgi:hypothetical protein